MDPSQSMEKKNSQWSTRKLKNSPTSEFLHPAHITVAKQAQFGMWLWKTKQTVSLELNWLKNSNCLFSALTSIALGLGSKHKTWFFSNNFLQKKRFNTMFLSRSYCLGTSLCPTRWPFAEEKQACCHNSCPGEGVEDCFWGSNPRDKRRRKYHTHDNWRTGYRYTKLHPNCLLASNSRV